MGFTYRKSYKAGPFRITACKSGISYSAGVKGARVTKRADGRVQTTLSAPGTGLRYTSTTGGGRPAAAHRGSPAGSLYRQVYDAAIIDIRDKGHAAAELRTQFEIEGVTDRQVFRAVADAEKFLARQAMVRALTAEAAGMLRQGSTPKDMHHTRSSNGAAWASGCVPRSSVAPRGTPEGTTEPDRILSA
jgi:hypothetical protein